MKEFRNHLVIIINVIGFIITLTIIQSVAVAQKDSTRAKLLLRDRVVRLADDLAMRLSLNEDQTKKVQDILNSLQDRVSQADRDIQNVLDQDQKVRYEKLKNQILDRMQQRRNPTGSSGRKRR